MRLDPLVTSVIRRPLVEMMATVNFDDQSLFQADEIDDVRAEWLLTAKFVTVEPPAS